MRQKEGFKDQQTFVIPEYIIKEVKKNPLSKSLYLTDIGFYPIATNHYRTRAKGCSQYILMYCIKGKGWISLNGKITNIKTNQYFIIPANKPHSYGSDTSEPWSIYWVHYTGDSAPLFSNYNSDIHSITPLFIDRIEERILLFNEILQNLEMGYSIDNINYANICLRYFLASFLYLPQFRQIRKSAERDFVDLSVNYMKSNINKKITLDDLAKEANLSISHYSIKFKRKTGKSPLDYFIQLKVQKACQLLDHTSLRINEISLAVGYDDPYYFSRIFKKIMYLSPSEYRLKPKG